MAGERREFSRIPIPFDQSATFLRAGIQQYTVHLIDATPQGYAVTCPERLNVSKGDVFQLRTSEGWVEVRVARIEPLDDTSRYDEEYDCFIGLQRLRHLGYAPDDIFVTAGSPRVLVLGLVVAIVIGLVTGAMFLPQSKFDLRAIRSSINSILK